MVASVIASACASGDEASPPPGWTERDSAGVTIIENATPVWTEETRWRVDTVPSLDIGRAEGEAPYLFDRIFQALRLRNGNIAVLSIAQDEIRIFDPAGVYVRTVGRRGRGPGEFSGLWWMAELPGDSLLAADIGLYRISVFGPDGRLARDHRLQSPPGAFEPAFRGRFDSGTLLGYGGLGAGTVPAAAPGFTRSQRTYFTLDDTGAVETVLGDFVEQTGGGGRGMAAFGPWAHQAVWGNRFYFAPGDHMEVLVHDAAGNLDRIVRLERPPIPVTEAHQTRYRDSLNALFDRRGAMGAEMRARYGEPQFYPYFPAVGALLVDATGNLWVSDYQTSYLPPTNRWTVFDPDGHYLGDVTMPVGLTVDQIGEDFVLGRWNDAFDVEHVRMYSLVRQNR